MESNHRERVTLSDLQSDQAPYLPIYPHTFVWTEQLDRANLELSSVAGCDNRTTR